MSTTEKLSSPSHDFNPTSYPLNRMSTWIHCLDGSISTKVFQPKSLCFSNINKVVRCTYVDHCPCDLPIHCGIHEHQALVLGLWHLLYGAKLLQSPHLSISLFLQPTSWSRLVAFKALKAFFYGHSCAQCSPPHRKQFVLRLGESWSIFPLPLSLHGREAPSFASFVFGEISPTFAIAFLFLLSLQKVFVAKVVHEALSNYNGLRQVLHTTPLKLLPSPSLKTMSEKEKPFLLDILEISSISVVNSFT